MALFKICILRLNLRKTTLEFTELYQFLKTNKLQIFRFLISGVIASIVNYLFYILLYFIFNNIVLASFCGYLMGLLVSFVFAKIWVFRNRSTQPIAKSFSIFCLIYFLGGLEMSFVILFINQLINNHKIAWLFGAFVASLNNYLGSKYFSFRD